MENSKPRVIAQVIAQLAIVAAMLVGAIYVVRSTEAQPMNIDMHVGVPAQDDGIAVGRTLASPSGKIEGWFE